MKFFALLVVTLFVAGVAAAQPTVWKVDPVHSNITFAVDYMVLTEVTGNFRDFSATMVSDSVNPGKSSVNVVIKTASITTENDRRDAHLRSADFFDAERYPEITFVSKSIEKGEGNQYKITGDLTMHGVTKSVTFDAKYMGQVRDMRGNLRLGFKGTTTINRNDFGVKYNATLETGRVLIGENVTVTVNAQLCRSSRPCILRVKHAEKAWSKSGLFRFHSTIPVYLQGIPSLTFSPVPSSLQLPSVGDTPNPVQRQAGLLFVDAFPVNFCLTIEVATHVSASRRICTSIRGLKNDLAALLEGEASPAQVKSVVRVCHANAEGALARRGHLNHLLRMHGLSLADLAYDCISDLFARDGDGRYKALESYFSAYGAADLSDEEIYFHLQRLSFTKVRNGLFRAYSEMDPQLARILHNVKVAARTLGFFIETDRLGESCLVPSLCDTSEHLPPVEVPDLTAWLSAEASGNEFIPELLGKLSMSLRKQTSYSRIVPDRKHWPGNTCFLQ